MYRAMHRTRPSDRALLPRIEADRIIVPADEPGARGYSEWSSADGIELPIRCGALTLGRFVLVPRKSTCGVAIAPSLRADAIALAQLAGDELRRRWTDSDPAPTRRDKDPS